MRLAKAVFTEPARETFTVATSPDEGRVEPRPAEPSVAEPVITAELTPAPAHMSSGAAADRAASAGAAVVTERVAAPDSASPTVLSSAVELRHQEDSVRGVLQDYTRAFERLDVQAAKANLAVARRPRLTARLPAAGRAAAALCLVRCFGVRAGRQCAVPRGCHLPAQGRLARPPPDRAGMDVQSLARQRPLANRERHSPVIQSFHPISAPACTCFTRPVVIPIKSRQQGDAVGCLPLPSKTGSGPWNFQEPLKAVTR